MTPTSCMRSLQASQLAMINLTVALVFLGRAHIWRISGAYLANIWRISGACLAHIWRQTCGRYKISKNTRFFIISISGTPGVPDMCRRCAGDVPEMCRRCAGDVT
eukprot:251124-Pyramimonas_sp.AAC.1